jgi:dTDP-glucose pyrophosphorylase
MSADLLKKNPAILLRPSARLRDAAAAMTKTGLGIALAVDGRRKLLGVVTDIDIRRALLGKGSLDAPLSGAMKKKPVTAPVGASREALSELFRRTAHAYIPVVDDKGSLKGLAALLDHMTIPARHPNWVVVMAGGVGKRLLPLTAHTPKPLVKVGGKPIMEILIDQLVSSGFHRFIFSVNHLADQIKDHFGDGERWDARFEYVHESKPLGTAGALGLIKRDLGDTFFVVNGDIMTKVDFRALLNFHKKEKALATVCIKQHEVQIPYGVIELADNKMERFVEKPVQRYFVNAGIYALEPSALKALPKGRCDMPELLRRVKARRAKSIACFPLQEYWLDVGRVSDHERASSDYSAHFGRP